MANALINPASNVASVWIVPRQAPPTRPQIPQEETNPVGSYPVQTGVTAAYHAPPVPIIYAGISRLPPVAPALLSQRSSRPLRTPVKVGFVLNTFSFGGSETETIELVSGANPSLLEFTGIAVASAQPLPDGEPRKDGSFPPIYSAASPHIDRHDPRVKIVGDFEEAVRIVTRESDIVITWGLSNLQEFLPAGRLPKIVVHSKDSGDWARSFLRPNSLVTTHYVANSTLAGAAFPEPLCDQVKVIHNGINPQRVAPRVSRTEQRRLWGFAHDDKIAGYLGRIERDKGVTKTVDGVSRLGWEWKAVFVGVSPNSGYTDELRRACEEVIPGRYRLLPWSHDIGSALAALDVFCHPSEHEGFSNSIAEAWLAGIPTVYTRNTGAVPDLGDLGVGVSPKADGAEIALALLKAYGNQQLVRRARQVIENGFLVSHNVQRWTDYLFGLHQRAEKARVLLLFPTEFAGRASRWLPTFRDPEVRLELCCVAFEGACNCGHDTIESRIYKDYRCPCFHIGVARDLAKLLQYTRPDVILTFQSPAFGRLFPMHRSVPVVILPPEPGVESANWVHWSRYLAGIANPHVFA